jgi:hypothetical protein
MWRGAARIQAAGTERRRTAKFMKFMMSRIFV